MRPEAFQASGHFSRPFPPSFQTARLCLRSATPVPLSPSMLKIKQIQGERYNLLLDTGPFSTVLHAEKHPITQGTTMPADNPDRPFFTINALS